MIRADDPRVTAYALDEGDLADRRAVEAAIASDPEVAAAVEATRATAREARGAFDATRTTGLAPAQRAAVLEAARAAAVAPPTATTVASGPVAAPSWPRRWAPFAAGLATAAGLLVTLSRSDVGARRDAGDSTRVASLRDAVEDFDPPVVDLALRVDADAVRDERQSLFGAEGHETARRDPGASHAPPTLLPAMPPGTVEGPRVGLVVTPAADATKPASDALRLLREALPVDRRSPSSGGAGHPASGSGGAGGGTPTTSPLSVGGEPYVAATSGGGGAGGGFVDLSRPDGATQRLRILGRLERTAATRGLDPATGAAVAYEYRPFAPVAGLEAGTTFGSVEECVERVPAGLRWVKVGEGYALVSTTDLPPTAEPTAGETYDDVVESPFLRVADAPLSTFSIDVDTASYSNVRRMLRAGTRPPKAAVRVEELVNYFPYAYAPPTGPEPFAVHLEAAACPWNGKHVLVRVGLKGREVEKAARPPMNLVFLVDVSGSMDAPNKLPLVQASMRMLLEDLAERDSVAIVVYAGASGLVLPPTSCERKDVIQAAIDGLRSGGSTNGAAGIELAYQVAAQRFDKGAVNRVVLATDGDFNVGVTDRDALLALVTEKAKSGVFLTCLGFGMGNLKDATLEMLADKGNGNYGYVDSTKEARKVLVEGAAGTLVTIAKDVKLQVEFNPAVVSSYRLVGYDNRRLAARDFADDTKDAGEVGAGHTVTALYEVVPVGAEDRAAGVGPDGVEPLRYGPQPAPALPPVPPPPPIYVPGGPRTESPPVVVEIPELLTVKVRWKEPTGTTSTRREHPMLRVVPEYAKASPDFKFAAAVASFAMLLKGSAYAGHASFDAVEELAGEGLGFDPSGYRKEFLELVAAAKALPK